MSTNTTANHKNPLTSTPQQQHSISEKDSTASSSTPSSHSYYTIRPYNSTIDEQAMLDICRDVWNGTDYLPKKAIEFEKDDTCDFVVMIDERTNNEVVALGNRRIMTTSTTTTSTTTSSSNDNDDAKNDNNNDNKLSWIEAIRISSKHQKKGLATILTKSLMERSMAKDGIQRVMSCTVEGNVAMKKVFGRIGLHKIHQMQYIGFDTMKMLPGWSAGASTSSQPDADDTPQNILQALNLENLIQESTKSTKWTTIQNEDELNQVLNEIKNRGGIGYLPGIGKIQVPASKHVRECIEKGLIRIKVVVNENQNDNNMKPCVYGMIQDTAITSLKSKWVCCICGLDSQSVEEALWDACTENMVERRGGEVAFATIFDGLMLATSSNDENEDPSSSHLIHELPIRTENPFNLYCNMID